MLLQPCAGGQARALQLLPAAMMNTVARRTMQYTTPCQKSGTGLLSVQSTSLCACLECRGITQRRPRMQRAYPD